MFSRTLPTLFIILTLFLTSCGQAETPVTSVEVSPTEAPLPALSALSPTSTPFQPHPPPPSFPTPSGSGGGVIAFNSERDGNLEVYVMNADGSDQRRLTPSSSQDAWPTWSPDGTSLAFHYVRAGRSLLNYINLSTGSIRELETSLKGKLWEPAWSHNGQWIAFSNQTSNRDSDIYLITPDGKQLTQLTTTEGIDGSHPGRLMTGKSPFIPTGMAIKLPNRLRPC